MRAHSPSVSAASRAECFLGCNSGSACHWAFRPIPILARRMVAPPGEVQWSAWTPGHSVPSREMSRSREISRLISTASRIRTWTSTSPTSKGIRTSRGATYRSVTGIRRAPRRRSGDGGLGPSVGAHLQIVEQQAWGAVQLAHQASGFAVHFDHADGKAAQPSHVLGSHGRRGCAVVLVPVVAVIEDAMQGVFDGPAPRLMRSSLWASAVCGVWLVTPTSIRLRAPTSGAANEEHRATVSRSRTILGDTGPPTMWSKSPYCVVVAGTSLMRW